MNYLQDWLEQLLKNIGVTGDGLPYLKAAILLLFLILVAYISFLIVKTIIIRVVHTFILNTKTTWDDILVEHKVFRTLAHIVPVLIFKAYLPEIFGDFALLLPFLLKLTNIYITVVIVMIIMSFIKGVESHLVTLPLFKNNPLASYFQLARIFIYIVTGILILSILIEESPVYFLSAFGAMSAILLLIFKDTILGLETCVQIYSNDMIRVGDWIEMPKYNADGDVLAINLNTVKVKNWDKTVTTVPTFYFFIDSFKNWRGMQESGGRRIKRSIYINLRSIKFVDEEM